MAVANPQYTQTQPPQQQPAAPDYNRDYWAPDRAQVLASKGIQDTSGKTWNGSDWVTGSAAPAQQPANQPGQSGPWNGAGVPAGFTVDKWNNPTFNDPKYDVGHMVASGWGNDQISQWMQSHPQEFAGYNVTGKDTITDAQGNVFDFRMGMGSDPNGQGTAQWTAVGGPGGVVGGSPMNGTAPGIPGTQSLAGGGYQSWLQQMGLGNGTGSSPFSQNPGAFNQLSNGLPYPTQGGDLFNIMMGKASQNEIPSASDPIIKNQTDAYDATQQRARRNYLADLAEKSGPNANMGAESRMTAEQLGQNDAQFQATLMGNELQQRRQEIMQALQMGSGFLTDEQRLALQQQLGLIQAYMQQQGINSQNDQFMANLGLNAEQQANYWDWVRSTGSAP